MCFSTVSQATPLPSSIVNMPARTLASPTSLKKRPRCCLIVTIIFLIISQQRMSVVLVRFPSRSSLFGLLSSRVLPISYHQQQYHQQLEQQQLEQQQQERA